MANKTLSYDYVNLKRDMNDVFKTVVENNPVTSRLLTITNDAFNNTKMEWLNDFQSALSWAITGAYTAGDGEVLTTDTSNLKEGMIVEFDKPANAGSSTLIAKVGTITTNTKFLITIYGGSTDEDLAVATTIKLLDIPENEGTDAQNGEGVEPVADFNYSQIMSGYASVSKTSFNSGMYGINKTPGEVMNYQVERELQNLAYRVASTSLKMPRVKRTSSEPGTMGGRLWFLQQQGGVNATNANGANITSAILNQAFEKAYSYGNVSNNTIVANPIHAKFFRAMNQTNSSLQTQFVMKDETTAGSYVVNFISDFGDQASIVFSPQMDKDKIAIINPSLIRLRPFVDDAFSDEDATLPGSRNLRRRITGQYSLEVKNPKTMQYIYGVKAT